MKTINPEYLRKIEVAARMADDAWIANGLDGMSEHLRYLRRMDADPLIISEVDRLYHAQCARVIPEERLAA